MVIAFITWLSILLQLLAAAMALRLAWLTRAIGGWSLVATALLLIVIRRIISLVQLLQSGTQMFPNYNSQLIESILLLVISILFVIGTYTIAPVFRSIIKSQTRLSKLNRTLRMLSGVNQILIRETDEASLLNNTCKLIVEQGGYTAVWVGFTEAAYGPEAFANCAEGYEDMAAQDWSDAKRGIGPAGQALNSGEVRVIRNITEEPTCLVWAGLGCTSMLAVPLLHNERPVGVLVLYDKRPSVFDDEEVALVQELASDLAYGVLALRTRAARERAELELEESKRFVERITNASPDLIFVIDLQEIRPLYANRQSERYFGITPEEGIPLGRDFFLRFIHPDDLHQLMTIRERFAKVANGEIVQSEYRFKHPDGTWHWLRSRSVVFSRSADGSPARILGTAEDITDQKLEDEHRHEFYRRTIMAATEGKLVISDKTEIEEVAGPAIIRWEIRAAEDLANVRQKVGEIVRREGMEESRIYDFVLSAGEAITNAIKHAGGGVASLHKKGNSMIFVVSDEGPGIEALALPEVALKRGYSTARSMGMGYKAMISLADKVYLATGPGGTTVAIQMSLQPVTPPPVFAGIPDTWES